MSNIGKRWTTLECWCCAEGDGFAQLISIWSNDVDNAVIAMFNIIASGFASAAIEPARAIDCHGFYNRGISSNGGAASYFANNPVIRHR